ncbi:protein TonB [Sphingomonas naasensis]|uniref:Protein TonB n=1 Tax=Sphingomonas naasensis TaxID=1344951 RepID=A0A4S1W750_9SPHN|nr:energy transducer TonB [Sphingomonas naasensis]NIJ21231.1 protein TonB [Sphingomonas naasensis]TGX38674.1 energy transducer TonB [Sphingomonas naasensis]
MYAEHRYAPAQSRAVSLGGALLINGALIAGLIFSAPHVISKGPEGGIKVIDIFDPPAPPPDEIKPEPKPQPNDARVPEPTAPRPEVPTESDNPLKVGPVIDGPILPPLPQPSGNGDGGAVVEPAPPLPALIAAEQDPRFLKDFQPGYPSVELRAQRDGLVRIRVLIGTDGRVKAAEQVSATSDAFFEATRRQALSKWRFKPAARGGVPQESWKVMNVRFRIEDQ